MPRAGGPRIAGGAAVGGRTRLRCFVPVELELWWGAGSRDTGWLAGQAEVGEDGAGDGGGLDEGSDAAPGAAGGADEDLKAEGAAEEVGPGEAAGAVSAGSAGLKEGAGCAFRGDSLGGDGLAPGGPGREDAVVAEGVPAGARDEGGEAGEEGDWLEDEGPGAVGPGSGERELDPAVGAERDAVIGDRGAEEVAAQALEVGAVVAGDAGVGVKVEAVDAGVVGFGPGETVAGGAAGRACDAVTLDR